MLLTSKKKDFLIGHTFGYIMAEFTFSQFRFGWVIFGTSIKTLQIHFAFVDVIIGWQKVNDKGKKHLKELMRD